VEAKPKRKCEFCGNENDLSDKFCQTCSAPTQKQEKKQSAAPPPEAEVEAKPKRKCEFCGNENDPSDKFCQSCSAPTQKQEKKKKKKPEPKPEPEPEPETPAESIAPIPIAEAAGAVAVPMKKCPECGVLNEMDCRFCLECGENIQDLAPLEAPVVPPPVQVSPASQESVPALGESTELQEIQCKVCNTWNESGCKFCADCGELLVPADPNASASELSAPPPEKTEKSASAVKCPKCRRPNKPTLKFCRKCGWELAKAKPETPKAERKKKKGESSSHSSDSGKEEVAPNKEAEQPKEETHDCRQCGRTNPVTNIFCKKCGTRFSDTRKTRKKNAVDEISNLRRTNSALAPPPGQKKKMKERGIRCADPECAKPNRPTDAHCRKCGKPLPKPSRRSTASGDKKEGDEAPKLEKVKSAFLQKKDKGALQSQVGDWLKRRDEAELSKSSTNLPQTPGKLAIVQERERAAEEKAAAAKAKAEAEAKKKEEEAAALEARRWVQPKLFIVSENSIHPKRSILQVHLKNSDSQVVIDAKDVMWIWVGSKTNADQLKFAKDLAKFYSDIVLKESQRKSVLKEARERAEPAEFIKLFQGWQYPVQVTRAMHHSVTFSTFTEKMIPQGRASLRHSFPDTGMLVRVEPEGEKKLEAAPAAEPAALLKPATLEKPLSRTSKGGTSKEVLGMYMSYFPLERLQDTQSLPATLNMGSLETYLTDEDFQRLFKMNKDKFSGLPAWKKVQLKKGVGLF
jgi:membrane protease subunit (stomatin/prohibitin family)